MIQVYKFTAYVYAESEDEVKQLEGKMVEFVNRMRSGGRAVTASKLSAALDKWKENYFVKRYFES